MAIEQRIVQLSDPLLAPLLDGLLAEYLTRYGEGDEMAMAHPEDFDPPDGAFVALFENGDVIAGGGLRRYDATTCEVKRMWTRADRRRQGHAAAVLLALEAAATNAGYQRIVLETGPAQPEAQAMYDALGYPRTPPYGRYEAALAFERKLSSPRRPERPRRTR